jgi:bla regulator protein BlaR1
MIGWAIETLIASTLLMALVLVLRAPVRRAVGPQIAYALWSLPVLRMLLPPLPEAWRGQAMPALPVPADLTLYLGEPVAVLPAAPEQGLGWPTVVLIIWAVGALAFIGWHMIAYHRFCARLRGAARSRQVLAAGNVTMIESSAAAGPLAFGVWRKYVAFPADFADRYDDLERDLALAHELGHHARGDLLANWIALTVLAVHWFNPLAWRAFRAFRADQEMACDALVLSGRQRALRHAYGRAIVKSAHGGAVSAACHLHTVNEIKGRLRMLTRHERPSLARRGAGAAGIAGMALAALALTASGTRAAETMKEKVEDHTGIAIDAIKMPALPQITPPAPPEPPVTEVRTGKQGRTVLVRTEKPIAPAEIDRLVADARWRAEEAGRAAAAVRVPEVRSVTCGGEGPVSIVKRDDDSGRVVSATLCRDRIERRAATAERQAELAERHARRAEQLAMVSGVKGIAIARASIRGARAAIVGNPHLTDAQREAALAGLDEALREVEADAAAE